MSEVKEFLKHVRDKVESVMPEIYFYWKDVFHLFPKYRKSKIKMVHSHFKKPLFFDDDVTVDLLIQFRMSLSRYGDGEFGWMAGETLNSFQDYSDEFSRDLRKSFIENNDKLLIGIPKGLFYKRGLNLFSRMYWETIKAGSYKQMQNLVDFDRRYVNASITRPYIDYRSRRFSTQAFVNIRRLWNQRDIVIVEGEKSKLGMGNDLFDNARSIKRIICPAVNAYSKKNEIKKTIIELVDKDSLVLAALGPTASILAADMSKLGYQFVDIGHIDVEYMWYLMHATNRVSIPGKYVNESKNRDCVGIYDKDKFYLESIIKKIQ